MQLGDLGHFATMQLLLPPEVLLASKLPLLLPASHHINMQCKMPILHHGAGIGMHGFLWLEQSNAWK